MLDGEGVISLIEIVQRKGLTGETGSIMTLLHTPSLQHLSHIREVSVYPKEYFNSYRLLSPLSDMQLCFTLYNMHFSKSTYVLFKLHVNKLQENFPNIYFSVITFHCTLFLICFCRFREYKCSFDTWIFPVGVKSGFLVYPSSKQYTLYQFSNFSFLTPPPTSYLFKTPLFIIPLSMFLCTFSFHL